LGAPHPPAGKPQKKAKAEKIADPRHSEFIARWCEAFKSHRNADYIFGGAKDAVATKSLLRAFPNKTAEEIVAMAISAWNHLSGWNCQNRTNTIAQFTSAINDVRAELSAKGVAPKYTEQDLTAGGF
jgi:hypothetical protein